MSKMLIIIFLFIPFTLLGAHEHILHIGDDYLYLNSEKNTIPSLNVKIGDDVFYADMSTCPFKINSDSERELHISYEGKEYYVFDDTVDLYEFDENANLIGANPCLYLESTGTQYIDTGFMPNQDTRIVATIYQKYLMGTNIFGERRAYADKSFMVICTNEKVYRDDYNRSLVTGPQCRTNEKILIDKNKNITTFFDMNFVNIFQVSHSYSDFQASYSVLLFGVNTSVIGISPQGFRFYEVYIYDNDVLVRHFVPVPAGLIIGDYVVPSNGMWDIVEQKFYGNSGTGNFIYGID